MFGLTAEGFVKKDLQTIKTEIEQNLKTIFGQDIDVSDSSVFGQMVGLNAIRESNLWELAEEVYNSQNPDNADNTSLDRVVALVGVTRTPAIATSVMAGLTGEEGITVTTGSLAEQMSTSLQYSLLADVTLSKSSCIGVLFEIDNVIDSTIYTIDVNGTLYTFDSGIGATAESIIIGLGTAFNLADHSFIDNLDGSAQILVDDSTTEFSFLEDSNMVTVSSTRNGQFSGVVTGANSLPAQTLNIIATPISGWLSVNNILTGTTGSDQETDQELRIRTRTAQRALGRGTDEAIKGRMLVLEDVTNAIVVSNRTLATVDSRPPKSFEAVVVGGTDEDVANELWLSQPAGIESYGNTTVIVKDSEDNNQTINFSRPESIIVWIEISLTLYSEELFPVDGLSAIKDSIISFGETEYDISVDVLRERLYQPIFQTPGISSAVIKLGTSANPATPPASYNEVNIPISEREIASIDKTRMIVGIA